MFVSNSLVCMDFPCSAHSLDKSENNVLTCHWECLYSSFMNCRFLFWKHEGAIQRTHVLSMRHRNNPLLDISWDTQEVRLTWSIADGVWAIASHLTLAILWDSLDIKLMDKEKLIKLKVYNYRVDNFNSTYCYLQTAIESHVTAWKNKWRCALLDGHYLTGIICGT